MINCSNPLEMHSTVSVSTSECYWWKLIENIDPILPHTHQTLTQIKSYNHYKITRVLCYTVHTQSASADFKHKKIKKTSEGVPPSHLPLFKSQNSTPKPITSLKDLRLIWTLSMHVQFWGMLFHFDNVPLSVSGRSSMP